MPNWVMHHAEFYGKEDKIREIAQAIDDHGGFLSHIIPLPPEATETIIINDGTPLGVFAEGGYEMALDLWGSKWGDCDTRYEMTDLPGGNACLSAKFNSAWGPIDVGLQRLCARLNVAVTDFYWEEQPEFVEIGRAHV